MHGLVTGAILYYNKQDMSIDSVSFDDAEAVSADEGEPVTTIEQGSTGAMKLYARWKKTT